MRGFVGTAIAAAGLFSSALAQSVDPIVIKGSKFFYKTNGTQFYIRGVAYQQDYTGGAGNNTGTTMYTDPLADSASCMRDIPYLMQLRTNTIRVYAIDPTKDHSACMNALANAGIYVISDMSDPDPGDSIDRNSPQWNVQLYTRYTAVIDALAGYSNTLGFFAGNEVTNMYNNSAASAFVRAAVRDSKAYISQKGYRPIGVGYASDDDANIRAQESDYMNCGNQSSAIDFWGYNIYEWCGNNTFQGSGYADRTQEFANYSVPVFFAEYGCNTVQPRTFQDTPVIYGPDMENVWSGAIVFQYFQETNNFGLVTLNGNSVSTRVDFSYYSEQIASVSPTGISASAYTPTNSPRSCPATGTTWIAAASPLPPSPNNNLCECMYASLTCVVKTSVDTTGYGQLFGTVCGLDNNACAGINTNETNGPWGAYGMCSAEQQLSWALNEYYVDQNNNPSACAFGGSATTQSATSATGSCASLMSQAGPSGTGVVVAAANANPSGTTAAGGSGTMTTGTSGGSGQTATTGAASSSGKSAATGVFVSNSIWQLPALVLVAICSGVGMIVL